MALASGWGWLAMLRMCLSFGMVLYVITYSPLAGHPGPPFLKAEALFVALVPGLTAGVQFTRRYRGSRAVAVLSVILDAVAVFGTLALFSFDPRRYLLALVVVVQAEAGAVLGVGGGFGVWLLTSAGYLAIQDLSQAMSGSRADAIELSLRIGAGFLLAVGGGFLSSELSGERQLRLVEREGELQRLHAAEARYRSLVEHIPVVTYVDPVDRRGPSLYVSPQVEQLTGYSAEEWMADPDLWIKHLHPDDRDAAVAEDDRTNDTGEPFRVEYRLIRPDGSTVWIRDEATLIRDEHGRPSYWQGVMLDLTERKRAEQEVAFLAFHDPLTQLPNRAMFEQFLDLALARARRYGLALAVLYMDLDRFKEINDTMGHAAGDELLRQVALRLRRAVREPDVVARQGGDEFLVLLADLEDGHGGHGTDRAVAAAESAASRVHEAFEGPFLVDGVAVDVKASIGISAYPLRAQTAEDLMKQADDAMYRSKRAAPGKWVVFPADEPAPVRASWTTWGRGPASGTGNSPAGS